MGNPFDMAERSGGVFDEVFSGEDGLVEWRFGWRRRQRGERRCGRERTPCDYLHGLHHK